MISEIPVAVTTTGAAGAATGTGETLLSQYGLLHAIRIDYHASAPATTDVTVRLGSATGDILLKKDNFATDTMFYPRVPVHNAADGAAVATWYDKPVACGKLHVSVAGSNALTNAVVVTAYVGS